MRLISIILLALVVACNGQVQNGTTPNDNSSVKEEPGSQIGQYVTSVFQDSKGNLWFGTIANGIARYDGTSLKYFTQVNGLPTNRVTSVAEDSEGIYWFLTGEGLSKYDGNKFVNLQVNENDWQSNMLSQFFIDSKGKIWVGTWGGVYIFDREKFTPFPLPYPEVDTPINKDTKNWITEIKEDAEGNIWFARDGYGACKYDGKSFTHYTTEKGLLSNNLTEIEFDDEDNAWFGTRVGERDNPDPAKRSGRGGVNKLENGRMLSFPVIEGFNHNDVYEIYNDDNGNVWISTVKNGVYKYDGKKFIHFDVPVSVVNMCTDNKGNLWLAGAGGLYKINKEGEIINVKTNGPWS